MAEEGLPKADTLLEEAKEPNPDGVDVAGFAGVENGPKNDWLVAREDCPKATGADAANEPNPDVVEAGGLAGDPDEV